MKKFFCISSFLLFASGAFAVNLNYNWGGYSQKISGFTEYHIQFPVEVYVTDGVNLYLFPATGHSVLAYPIDGYAAGAKFSVSTVPAKRKAATYLMEFSLSKTLTQPQEAMVDSDWVSVPDIGLNKFVFGATESGAELTNYNISVSAGVRINIKPSIEWTGAVGYDYMYYRYDMTGLSGWYDRDWNGVPEPLDINEFSGVNVLDYQVKYHTMALLNRVEFTSTEGLKLFADVKWFPYVRALDIDDHLLRSRMAKSDCKGSGFRVEGGTKINIYTFASNAKLYLGGGYSLMRLKASGSQIQEYYANSTDYSYDETGMKSEPIDNTLKLKQDNINIYLEYKP
jgi:outer membrane protease